MTKTPPVQFCPFKAAFVSVSRALLLGISCHTILSAHEIRTNLSTGVSFTNVRQKINKHDVSKMTLSNQMDPKHIPSSASHLIVQWCITYLNYLMKNPSQISLT